MHIAFYHDARIPPLKYGGTERIIYWLAQALNQLGHQTTLVAKPGSFVPGSKVVELSQNTQWQKCIPADTDIIHLWGTPSESIKKPFLVTIEGNGQPGEFFHPNTLFISKKHAENHGSTHYVYNGIDVDTYPISIHRENHLVFLAKASWSVKNLEGAIEIARKAGLPLHVLGSRDWPFNLHRKIPRPFSRLKRLYFHGMVDDEEKKEVLSKARALIFPVRWHEPFGIAITEALASGCYVLATPYGSLPEIVTPEVGILSIRSQDLIKAALTPEKFSPLQCRKRVKDKFSHIEMAKAYLSYYRQVLETGSLSPQSLNPPFTHFELGSKNLLDWNVP